MKTLAYRAIAIALASLAATALAGCGKSAPASCTSDVQCSDVGLVCDRVDEVCVECNADADCLGSDQVCRGNACVQLVACTTSRQCTGQVCDTFAGFCVDCLANTDCADDEHCSAGVCEDGPPPCASSSDCIGDEVCDLARGACVECVTLTDCDEGETCRGGECGAADDCSSDVQCTNQVCHDTAGVCVDCERDADCLDDDTVCGPSNTCIDAPTSCTSDTHCSADGLVCDESDGRCVECVVDADCISSGLVCSAAKTCVTDTGCTPFDTREVACGNCGTEVQQCDFDGTWLAGTCTGQGACEPGDTRTNSCGAQTCNSACTWTGGDCGMLDVLLVVDASGSFSPYSLDATGIASLVDQLVTPLVSGSLDVRVGVAYFSDVPIDPYGSAPGAYADTPFVGYLPPTSSASAVSTALDSIPTSALSGGDLGEGGVLALSYAAGGGPSIAGGIPFTCPAGTSGGGCFRDGAQRAVVVVSDAEFHGAPGVLLSSSGAYSVDVGAPTWSSVATRLRDADIKVFALTDSASLGMWEEMQLDLLGNADYQVVSASDLTGVSSWDSLYANLFARMAAEYDL